MSLLRFEYGVLLKSPAFILIGLAAFGFGFLVPVDEMGPGMESLDLAAGYRIHFYAVCAGFLIPLIMLVGVQLTFLRDELTGFKAIARSLQQGPQSNPKWLALSGFGLIWASLVSVSMALGFWFKMNAFPSMAFFLHPWLLYTLPNVWIGLNLLVWSSRRWPSFFTPFAVAMAIWIAIWIAMAIVGFPVFGVAAERSEWLWWLSFVEPFGLTTFFHETKYWTVELKNENGIPLSLPILVNRFVWLSAAFFLYFKQPREKPARIEQATVEGAVKFSQSLDPVHPGKPPFFSVFWLEIRRFYGSWPWFLIMLTWIGLCCVGILMARGVLSESISPRLPSTSLLLSYMAEPFYPFGILAGFIGLLLTFWRERKCDSEDIWKALPVSNGQMYLGKLFAVCTLPIVFMLCLIFVGILYQWSVRYAPIDYGHWLQSILVFGGPLFCHLLFASCLAMFGYFRGWHFLTVLMVTACMLWGVAFVPKWLHWFTFLDLVAFPNLLREHSEMRGYGLQWSLFLRVLVLWGSFLVLLVLHVGRVCPRPGRRRTPFGWGLGLSCFLAVSSLLAGFHFKNHSGADLAVIKAEYEKQWGSFSTRDIPQILHMENQLDLFPNASRLLVSSRNQVENTTGKPIAELLITSRLPLQEYGFSRPSHFKKVSSKLNVYLATFQSPWLPGEVIEWHYQTEWKGNSYNIQHGLDASASYFLQSEFEPLLGYYQGLEIRDPEQRKRFGLPAKSFPRQDTHRFGDHFIQRKRTFVNWMSTVEGQLPLSSGLRVETLRSEGRIAVKYVSEKPVYPVLGYFSAGYQQRQFQVGQISVIIYFHPAHTVNLDMVERSIRETMSFCSGNFGAYPFSELRVIEIPSTFATGGRASAGVVALNEAGLFMLDPDPGDAINTVVRRTVHEVAHQWFGEKMVPKLAPGEKILNESLTKYVEAKVVEMMLGSEMLAKINRASQHRYLVGKSRVKDEVPLIEADDYYLAYGKGGLVFQSISDLMGEERFHQALRTFISSHRNEISATMPALLEHLIKNASPEEGMAIEEMLTK